MSTGYSIISNDNFEEYQALLEKLLQAIKPFAISPKEWHCGGCSPVTEQEYYTAAYDAYIAAGGEEE